MTDRTSDVLGLARERAARARARLAATPGGQRPLRLGASRSRLRVVVVISAALLLLLGTRLVWLQGVQSSAYAAQGERQRLRTVTLHAQRGAIFDRNGHPLAMDVDARAVYADPSQLLFSGGRGEGSRRDVPAAVAVLAPLLHVDAAALTPRLASETARFVYLARGLTPADGARVQAAVDKAHLGGVHLLKETKRVYPGNDLAANVVGFTGSDGQGLAGYEMALDRLLTGRDGSLTVEEDGSGRDIPQGFHREVDPVAGTSVTLTIDRDIQYAAQDALASKVKETGADGGSVTVMDPRTGQVLAMAVAPTFNLSDPGAVPAASRGNRTVSQVFEPGSVNKVIVASEAIEHGVVTPATPVTVPPTYFDPAARRTFHDAEPHGTEHLTFAGVIAKSSNIGTMAVARQLGKQQLWQGLHDFGYGQTTGLGFPGESAGLLAPWQQWGPTEFDTIPFGQGVSTTALQACSVYATVANAGVRLDPSLIASTTSPDGVVHPAAGGHSRRVVGPATAATVTSILEQVTGDQGTGTNAAIPGYRVAGKTGTAQRPNPAGRGYDGYFASFIGFAPANDPRLVVQVTVDNPQTSHFGGEVAAPVFHDVMSFALQSLQVPSDGSPAPVLPLGK